MQKKLFYGSVFIEFGIISTSTNVDGKYFIEANKGNILVYSFVGMITREVVAGFGMLLRNSKH